MMVLSSISYWMAFLGQMIQIDEELWAAWAVTKILFFWALRNAGPGKCLWRWFVCTFGPCKITLHSSCAEYVQTLVQSYNVIKQASLRSMFWNNVKDIQPGKLTWNLKITHLKGKPSEPNLHFWVSAVSFRGAIQKRIVDRGILGFWMIWIYRAFCITPPKKTGWWDKVVLASMMFVGMQLVANDRTKVSLDGGETVRKTTLRGNDQKVNRSKFRVKESPKQSKSDEQLLFLFRCFCSSLSQVGQSE